ncbi:MFS transporter [Chloroflexota bacterium]
MKLKDRVFYGWVVVVGFIIMGATFLGIRISFGVFFKSLESDFGLSRAATSAVFSVYMVLGCIFAMVCGWALDRYGPRVIVLLMGIITGLSLLLTSQASLPWHLFITYSLLLALGTNSTYIVTMSTVSRWFSKKRGLALGIAGSGAGMGTIIMPPLATFLITAFDWRMAYIVMGAMAWLIVIPLSALLRKDPYQIGALPDGEKSVLRDIPIGETETVEETLQSGDLSLSQAFRTRSFWLFLSLWLFFATNTFLVLTHLVPHITDIGFSAGEAAAVLSLMGIVTIAGRVVMGIVADRIGRKNGCIICLFCQFGAMIWLVWAQDLWGLYVFAVVYGFAYAGMSTVMAAIVSDTFGLSRIGAIFGVLELGFGAGAALGPAIGGFIFDVTNSYDIAFLIGAFAMLIATLLIPPIRRETGRGS